MKSELHEYQAKELVTGKHTHTHTRTRTHASTHTYNIVLYVGTSNS
jgi:hypothetical protein